jgi:hypothetical protein
MSWLSKTGDKRAKQWSLDFAISSTVIETVFATLGFTFLLSGIQKGDGFFAAFGLVFFLQGALWVAIGCSTIQAYVRRGSTAASKLKAES